MLAFAVSVGAAQGEFGPGVYAGLWGRLLMVGFGSWVLIAGYHMLRLRQSKALAKGTAI